MGRSASAKTGLLGLAAVLSLVANPALGVVLHDDADAPADKPSDPVVGRWRGNGSAVAIGRSDWPVTNYVLTAQHLAGSGSVWFDTEEYLIAATFNHSPADIRVARIKTLTGGNPYFTDFVQPYTGVDETSHNVVIGGFGLIRGDELTTSKDVVYGYEWWGNNNTIQRWGTNEVDSTATVTEDGFTSDVIKADFDDPDTENAALGNYDSGGGWFIKVGSVWYVAGVSRTTEHFGESWFRNSATGKADPDVIDAVRVSSYATWIDSVLPPWPIPGDANRDSLVDGQDFTIMKANYGGSGGWNEGDFSGDGLVDGQDFTILKEYFGDNPVGGVAGGGVARASLPEPASLSLLALGACLPLCRRRSRQGLLALRRRRR